VSATKSASSNLPTAPSCDEQSCWDTYHLTNPLYFSSPIHPMKLVLASSFPSRYAVNPFSEKQKSKSVVTSTSPPICSCCLTKLEPPT